jgi:membrane protein DedA with SNARE-associated domain
MPEELALYISQYGYLIVFSLVFLQEIGIPNPVPNELVLLFSGYLASTGRFNFVLIFLVVVAADFIGTLILYIVFYHFEEWVMAHTPKWMPFRKEKLEKLSRMVATKGYWGIYLGRLIPYVRGYVSIAAGLLGIKPSKYVPAVILSAITWSGGYVILGHVLGPQWETVSEKFGSINMIVITGLAILALVYLAPKIYRRIKQKYSHG